MLLAGACERGTTPPASAPSPAGWLKGQTHAHSSRSHDSATPPDEVARWYAARGYDFLVLTDHDYVTPPVAGAGLIAVPGVELSAGGPRHLSALFVRRSVGERVQLPPGEDRYATELDEALDLGGVPQLDHPNYGWGADAAAVEKLAARGLTLLEIANQDVDVRNEGDDRHPSTEAMWDALLTRGVRVWGVASDDAHEYDDAYGRELHGEIVHPGDRGFVMVRARRDLESIRRAIVAGDFYSSTGVLLAEAGRRAGFLEVQIAGGEPVDFTFIGPGGAVLARAHGAAAAISLADRAGYVRAVVTDASGHKAWTQPVFVP
jgi:hypothetical protein